MLQVIQASCNMSSGGGLKNREEQSKKLKPGYGLKIKDGVGKERFTRGRRTALKIRRRPVRVVGSDLFARGKFAFSPELRIILSW